MMGSERSHIADGSQMREVDFAIHIAIAFGDDGCAIAYGYNDNVTIYSKWKTKTRQQGVKVNVQTLLNDKDEITSFGDSAKTMYSNFSGTEKTEWKFIDNLKMSLNGVDINNNGESSIYLETFNNKQCDADVVFIKVFEEIEAVSIEYMNKIANDKNIKKDEIQWIITIPATWNNKIAKRKINEWMIKAGLVNKYIKNQCLILYEVDCAALNALTEDIKGVNIDDRYILVNIGGENVDILCHKVVDVDDEKHPIIEEIHDALQVKLDESYIDNLYIKLLCDLFNKKWIDEFKQLSPNSYLEIIDFFQASKLNFYKKKQAKTHKVELPYEFGQHLNQKCSDHGIDIEQKVNKYIDDTYDEKENMVIKLEGESLKLDERIWKQMFDTFMDKIIESFFKLLNEEFFKNNKGNKYLILCGQITKCKYFQFKIRKQFDITSKYNLNVIIPKEPTFCVAKGAAVVGLKQKHFIKNKKLMEDAEDDKDIKDIKEKSPEKKHCRNIQKIMFLFCCICTMIILLVFGVVLSFEFLGQDLKRNEFNIYEANAKSMNFYDNINDNKYSMKMPIKLDGDVLMINGYGDRSSIEYIKEYKHPHLQPILYNDQSLMSILIIKSLSVNTELNGMIISYWCTNNGNDSILDNNGIDKYKQHFTIQNMEHEGKYLFIDKIYLDKNVPTVIGKQFGFDTHRVNKMQFEFEKNTFYMNGDDGGIDIKLNKNNDIVSFFGFIKTFGLKKTLKSYFNKNIYNDIFYYVKPNISNRTPIDVIPLIHTIYNIKQNSLFINKIDNNNNDNINLFGKLKNRKFDPVSYIYLNSKFITIPTINGDRLNDEIKNSKQKNHELNHTVSVLSELNNTLHDNLTMVINKKNKLNVEIANLMQEIQTLEDEKSLCKEKNNNSTETITNLTRNLRNLEGRVTVCNQKLNETVWNKIWKFFGY